MYYNNNDYRSYLEGDYLCHYGVLGMKWGVHKAKEYDRDLANYEYYNRASKIKNAYKAGSISKDERKFLKKKNKQLLKESIGNINNKKYADTKPDENKTVSSIYSKSKAAAEKTIPHYKLKKGLATAGKVASLAALGLGAYNTIDATRKLSTIHKNNAGLEEALNKAFHVAYGSNGPKPYYSNAARQNASAEYAMYRRMLDQGNSFARSEANRQALGIGTTAAGLAGYAASDRYKKKRSNR